MRLFVITGTCGSGKSTMRDALPEFLDQEKFTCIDSDETGLNWWDYAGTDHEEKYAEDGLAEAVRRAAGKDLIFVSCMAPQDYLTKITVSEEVKATYFIALSPSDDEIWRRLRARPAERGFTSDEVIRPHIAYNQWIRRNRGKYQLFIDNEKQTPEESAGLIATYIKNLPE